MKLLLKAGLALLVALYPLAIYLGVQSDYREWLPLLLVAIGVIHLLRALKGNRSGWLWVVICLVLAAWSWLQQSTLGIKFYPVAINVSMLLVFGFSLISPPTVIERMARLQEPELPPHAIAYTRKVTVVWCLFFILNGTIAGLTIFASDAVWALYNGLISYLLIGLLFAIEWLVRQRVRKNAV
ncbi:hypothetical protein [Pseudomaricurvus sp. HS19]|uniref:COG4648 family protein n=1 Tax=Pseudomaricurvus sp. HS19 TaxID=2692626 RepID=UPI001367EA5D|nr:hypothetical protein [Pseudomaricurvus sp. HS19]MYM63984.1 hypothetical protein [Pseudomaricurvus sp. HS19]